MTARTGAPGLIRIDQHRRTYATHERPTSSPAYLLEIGADEAVTLAHMLDIAYRADAVHANRAAARLLKTAGAMAADVLNADRLDRRMHP